MTWLVFVVCFAAKCDEHRVPVDMTWLQCTMSVGIAQSQMQQHMRPGDRLDRVYCEAEL